MLGFGQVGDDIERCVTSLRQRAVDYRQVFDRNETATRVQLIDPVLKAMDWDSDDPSQVRHEHRVSTGKLDYALFVGSQPVAIVEAKSLGTRLGSLSPGQLMRYGMDPECRQLEAFALSNGMQWVVHRKSQGWSDDAVDLSQEHPFRASFKLFELMHRSQFGNDIPRPHPEVSRVEPATIERPTEGRPLDGVYALSDRSLDPVVSGKQRPTFVVDHRGVSHPVRSWADFYRTAINALIDDGKITPNDCPIKFRPTRSKCLINSNPNHPNGRRFKKVVELRGGLFLEGDFGAVDFIRNLRVLLEHAGLPHDSIKIGFGRG